MPKTVFKLNLSTLAVLSCLAVMSGKVQAETDHRIADGVNKSGRPVLVIDDIVCKGNTQTDCDFITKKYYQRAGDILDPDEVADAKLRLGTLIQFRNVDIRLEKGHKRGHVLVVFDVNEASNIQYEWGTLFSFSKDTGTFCNPHGAYHDGFVESCSKTDSKHKSGTLTGTLTDFNFLGSGKRLSLGISGYKADSEFDSAISYNGTVPDYLPSAISLQTAADSYSLSLDYYDPHLFDSSHYYWRARVDHYRSSADVTSIISDQNQQLEQAGGNSRASTTPLLLEAGRRFGSHSYVSFDLNQVINDNLPNARTNTSVGFNYGWDSRDDILFATKGSVFNSRYFYQDHTNSLALDYSSNHSLRYNRVLTWSVGGRFSHANTKDIGGGIPTSRSFSSLGLSARYTAITDIDTAEGEYSGWFSELSLGKNNGLPENQPNLSVTLNAGYSYQTASMIYRFTLGFNTMENL